MRDAERGEGTVLSLPGGMFHVDDAMVLVQFDSGSMQLYVGPEQLAQLSAA